MPSSKGEFYDSLVGREYTISSLMETHGLSRPTVSKWLKLQQIDAIPNSWPPRFTLNTKRNISADIESEKPTKYKPVNNVQVSEYVELLLKDSTNIDIATAFRSIKSAKDIESLIKGLEDTIEAARYYEAYLVKDGLI